MSFRVVKFTNPEEINDSVFRIINLMVRDNDPLNRLINLVFRSCDPVFHEIFAAFRTMNSYTSNHSTRTSNHKSTSYII